MNPTTARQILGVSSSANEDEIRRAYKEKVKEEHPDQSEEPSEAARERFKNIKEARDVLLDGLEGKSATAGTSSRSGRTTSDEETRTAGDDSRTDERARDPRETSSSRRSTTTSQTASSDPRGGHTTRNSRTSRTSRSYSNSTDNTTTGSQNKRTADATGETSRETSTETSGGDRSYADTTTRSRSGTAETIGRPAHSVTRGHLLNRWSMSSTDKRLALVSVGTIAYTFIAGLMLQFLGGPLKYLPIAGWAGLCGYLGYQLAIDEIPRRGWEIRPYVSNSVIVISPSEGALLPVVGLFAAPLVALPVWIGGGFVVGLVQELLNTALAANYDIAYPVTLGSVAEVIMGLYAPLVALVSVGAATLSDGPYTSEEYQQSRSRSGSRAAQSQANS